MKTKTSIVKSAEARLRLAEKSAVFSAETFETIAEYAVAQADALIAELDRDVNQEGDQS